MTGFSRSSQTASELFAFPEGFLWWAATASHQVEGGNRGNDWWQMEQDGRLPHESGEACRHYELYSSDFDLAKSMGHNAHRFSIEWSRIEPRQGEWNEAELEHYVAVIDALRYKGIEPVVTLHHFTNPAWFSQRGGWAREDSVDFFVRYVQVVATRLASRVRFWVTINEPTVYVKRAYITGDWPPCEPRSWGRAIRVLRNMCRAHAAAYPVLHRLRPDAMVGLAHSAPYITACNPSSAADRVTTRLRDFALNDALFMLLGRRPGVVLDFIGLNFYARQVVCWRPKAGAAMLLGSECRDDHHGEPRAFTSLGWEIYAPGLRKVLRRFARHGVPLMVTENGIATSDEQLRTRYLMAHLESVAEAVRDGVTVLGYFYWTLMDNFEWTEGRNARFGLVEVDFLTQQRTVRPAARAYQVVCQSNSIEWTSPR